eukprot:scaffold108643_cov48-Phaeocystis_antarctica.AAC.1
MAEAEAAVLAGGQLAAEGAASANNPRYRGDFASPVRFLTPPSPRILRAERAVSRMLSLLAAGMVRGATTPSRSAARMCSKAGPIKFEMDFSANWFAVALASSGPSQQRP